MIQKPETTKKLAWIAFWLESGWIVLNIILVFLACVLPVPDTFSSLADVKIPLLLPVMAAVGIGGMIPFAWFCLRNALKTEVTENQAVSSLVISAVLYFVGILLNWLLNTGKSFLAVRIYSAEIAGAFSIRTQYQNILGIFPVQIAALVLVCCAAAIEIYILKHKES